MSTVAVCPYPFNDRMFDSVLLSEAEECAPLLVAVKKAAHLLGVKEITIRKWIADNRIFSVKLNSARRIPLSEIQRLAMQGTEANRV